VVALEVADLEARKARLGALAGDTAVRALARAIRSVVRADDLVYRWSGGEFLVVLPGVAPDEAQRRFARFDEALRGAGAADAGLELVASWGVAPYTPDQPMAAAVEAAVAAASVKRTPSVALDARDAALPRDSAGD
jgi:diguanylate cyclase (GGDEF)-like protein